MLEGDPRFKSHLWNDDKSSPTIYTHGDEVKHADEAKMFTILHIDDAGKLKFRERLDVTIVTWYVCIRCKQQCIASEKLTRGTVDPL